MMVENKLIFAIWGSFFAATFLYYLSYIIFFYYYKKVKSNSSLYKSLQKLNEKYEKIFISDIKTELNYTKICKSKKEFDTSHLDDILELACESEIDDLTNLLAKIMTNQTINKSYLLEYENIMAKNSRKTLKKQQMSNKFFAVIEKNLYVKNQLKPILNVEVTVSKVYSSVRRGNKYQAIHTYNFDELNLCVAKITKNIAYKKEQEYRRKIERAKVTPSLRWQILQLDGYKCRACKAASADGVKLHVDHIVPIAKNGTSDINNLQTLCENCNFGKSDRL